MIVELIRLESSHEHGTIGKVKIDKVVMFDSMEPYHRMNHRFFSCIPHGQYSCKRINSPRYGDTFEITNVEDRDNILFHWGNFDNNTSGCILLGNGISNIDGRRAVLNSKNSFKEFMNILKGTHVFTLTISENY